jgi:hypothetical protein
VSGEHWGGGGPPDAATSRAYWRLLDAAVKHAEGLQVDLDEAAFEYWCTLTPAARQIIAKRAREP